jgi:DNA primase catalytic core
MEEHKAGSEVSEQPGAGGQGPAAQDAGDLEEALAFFRSRLFEKPGRYGLEYLTVKRGYTRDEIEGMELGFFPQRQEVKIALGEERFEALGFETVKEFGQTHKIIIPCRDAGGRLQGFIARRIDSNRPKYIYSAHVDRDALFNLHAVKNGNAAYVTEGYFDALIATQRGITGVVATGFSALTKRMMEDLLNRGIKSLTLIPDNDVAGLRGAAASLEMARENGVESFVLELPEQYKDLDEFMRHEGSKGFGKLAGQVKAAHTWEVQALLSRRSNIKVRIKSADKSRPAQTYYISRGGQNR